MTAGLRSEGQLLRLTPRELALRTANLPWGLLGNTGVLSNVQQTGNSVALVRADVLEATQLELRVLLDQVAVAQVLATLVLAVRVTYGVDGGVFEELIPLRQRGTVIRRTASFMQASVEVTSPSNIGDVLSVSATIAKAGPVAEAMQYALYEEIGIAATRTVQVPTFATVLRLAANSSSVVVQWRDANGGAMGAIFDAQQDGGGAPYAPIQIPALAFSVDFDNLAGAVRSVGWGWDVK